jgi:hypothetical protein
MASTLVITSKTICRMDASAMLFAILSLDSSGGPPMTPPTMVPNGMTDQERVL